MVRDQLRNTEANTLHWEHRVTPITDWAIHKLPQTHVANKYETLSRLTTNILKHLQSPRNKSESVPTMTWFSWAVWSWVHGFNCWHVGTIEHFIWHCSKMLRYLSIWKNINHSETIFLDIPWYHSTMSLSQWNSIGLTTQHRLRGSLQIHSWPRLAWKVKASEGWPVAFQKSNIHFYNAHCKAVWNMLKCIESYILLSRTQFKTMSQQTSISSCLQ